MAAVCFHAVGRAAGDHACFGLARSEVKKMSSKHRSTDATHACVTTSSRVAPCLLPEKSEVGWVLLCQISWVTHACVTTSSRVAPCLLLEKSEVEWIFPCQTSWVTHLQVTTGSCVAPCLLPEKSEVVQVAALGPRYWPQVLSRTPTQPHPNHPQSGRVPPLPFLEPAAFPAPVADCASPPGRAALQQDSMLPPGSRSVTPYAGGRPGGADMRSPQPATLPAAQGDFCYR
eukprot:scaffold72226_cov19-Tisochrysis_lutea.AAC.2